MRFEDCSNFICYFFQSTIEIVEVTAADNSLIDVNKEQVKIL